jgi:sugar phosphate isomerase/epimerase
MEKIGIRVPGIQLDRNIKPFLDNLNMIKKTGFDCIEISPDDFDLIIAGKINKKALEQLIEVLSIFNFKISIHAPNCLNLMNREYPDLHRDVFLCCYEIAESINSKIIVFHPGRYVDNVEFSRYGKPDFTKKEKQDLIDKEMSIIDKAASEFPEITLAIENNRPYVYYSPYSYGESLEEMKGLITGINKPNVGFTIDTGHLNLLSGYYNFNPVEKLKSLDIRPIHLHIHDNHGIANFYTEKDKKAMLAFGRGDEHMVPGYGSFPFADFFEVINDYQGSYVLELTERYFYESKIIEAYKSIKEYLKEKRIINKVLMDN